MEKQTDKPNSVLSAIQNALAGIACSFYFIYRYYLSEPKIMKDLGSAYPWFMMIWVIVMLTSGGFSGARLFQIIIKYVPIMMKLINSVKKDIREDGN